MPIIKKFKHQLIECNAEILILRIFTNNYQFITAVTYISPLIDTTIFLEKFNCILEQLSDRFLHLPILVRGDFNAQIGELEFASEVVFDQNFRLPEGL